MHIKARPLNSFNVKKINLKSGGNLSLLLGMQKLYTDINYSITPKGQKLNAKFYFMDNKKKLFSKYSINEKVNNKHRVIVIHDSFFLTLRNFFSEHFWRVEYYHYGEANIKEIISNGEKPLFILHQFVDASIDFYYPGAHPGPW